MDYHISNAELYVFVALAIWELIWKGFALWRAAQANDRGWFIAMLVINSVGLLPIFYLLAVKKSDASEA